MKPFMEALDDVLNEIGAPKDAIDPDALWIAKQIVGVRAEIDGYSWTDAPENARRARIREMHLMSIARRLLRTSLSTSA